MFNFFGQFFPNVWKSDRKEKEVAKEVSRSVTEPEKSLPTAADAKIKPATVLGEKEQVQITDNAFHYALEAMEQLKGIVGEDLARKHLVNKIALENNGKFAEFYWQDQNTLVLLAENLSIGVTADMSATPYYAPLNITRNLITKLFAILFGVKGFMKIIDQCTEEKFLLVSADQKFFFCNVNLLGHPNQIKQIYEKVVQLNRNIEPEFETFFRDRFLIAQLRLANRYTTAEMILPKHYRAMDARNKLCAALYLHFCENATSMG